MKATKKQLLEQIRFKRGVVSEIADFFGMTPEGVRKRIANDTALKAAIEEAREELLDLAQCQLGRAVENGSAWAVKFILQTWGQSRGFVKTLNVDANVAQAGTIVLHLPDDGRESLPEAKAE